MILVWTVPDGPDRKAYTILRRELKASAAFVRRLKAAGALFVNGEPAFTDRILRPGDVLTADVSACEPPCGLVPESGPLEILAEDEGLLAVNKPEGVMIHPTRSRYGGTLSNRAAGWLLEKGEDPVVHAVNRLDRDTSGAVLLAKNSYMKAALSASLSAPDAGKEYLAAVFGRMPADHGTVDAPIVRPDPADMRREVRSDGRPAVTRWKVFGEADGISLLSLALETGRTHQIRVHCAHLGCPLLGDVLYGSEASIRFSSERGIRAHLLHARRLSFTHPLSGERISLTAPVRREDFLDVLKLFPICP